VLELIITLGWFTVGYAIRKCFQFDTEFERAKEDRALLFSDRFVSGKKHLPLPLPSVGAGWGLDVIVDSENVWIWPMLAFRPTFLGIFLGLEHKVRRKDVSIQSIAPAQRSLLGRRRVVLSWKTSTGNLKTLSLYLKEPERFVQAISL
jgi:hypothetical protein